MDYIPFVDQNTWNRNYFMIQIGYMDDTAIKTNLEAYQGWHVLKLKLENA